MIKKILSVLFSFLLLNCISYSAVIKRQVIFNPNNISTCVWNTGVFNQDLRYTNNPGFEWPKGSGIFAVFTSGLCIGSYVNGELRLANASYNGEYAPGYVGDSNGIPVFKTDSRFRLYSVKYYDTQNSNPDVAAWKDMVHYGAPFNDLNNNKIYDIGIDKPGVPDADQTIFICLTDADASNHTTSEGFSGGTRPLNAEVHLTAWGYYDEPVSNVQFFKWDIVNKNNASWNKTYFSIVTDPDLGYPKDEYIGCDSLLQLGYCYNGNDTDGTGAPGQYGLHPPAVGQTLLRSAINNNTYPLDTLNATSMTFFVNTESGGPLCETDPSSAPSQAYNYMRGYKKDGTPWLDPTYTPYKITKFCYPGNPEDSTGWTERKGRVYNCGGATTGLFQLSYPGERRFMISTGSDFLNVNPGDTQKIAMAQLIARGSSNLNSVTKLKELTNLTKKIYYQAIEGFESYYVEPAPELPTHFKLYQNYPNPFNPVTTIKYEVKMLWKVKIQLYDTRGELLRTLVNEEKPQGVYEVKFDASNLPSGIYFIKMTSAQGFESSKKMVIIK
ncbi:MAG: T9SS type A sorting domain-containing protein [Bacteroidetes bacterium]|nr:T9SS type A sorting domain-containing protein [Bacteroidota bacterium]